MKLTRSAVVPFLLLALTGAAGAVPGPHRPGLTPRPVALSQEAKSYPSLDSALAALYAQWRADPTTARACALVERGLQVSSDDRVTVWLAQAPGTDTAAIDVAALERLGGRVEGQSRHFLEASIPIAALPRVAAEVPGVTHLRQPPPPRAMTISEGVALTGADAYHAAGLRGTGAKVAVLDYSFVGVSDSIAQGDLPPDLVAVDLSGAGMETPLPDYPFNGHGTACTEAVYDMAPAAQLHAIKLGPYLSGYERGIDYCVENGIEITSQSIGQFSVSFFDGTGPLCDIVDRAYAQGVLSIVAAGNQADAHQTGPLTDEDRDGWHEFAPGVETMRFGARGGSRVDVLLNYDAWPTTAQDLDLYVLDENMNPLAWATGAQTGSQPPLEFLSFIAPRTSHYYLGLWRQQAEPGVTFHVHLWQAAEVTPTNPRTSICTPSDARTSLAVGGILMGDYLTGPQAWFSSQGPTTDGRLKPDLAAPTGGHTYTWGECLFCGTSAATPHVAGAAALLKSEHPGWGAAELRQALLDSTVDMGDPGPDNVFGWGRLSLVPHVVDLTSVQATPDQIEGSGTVQLEAVASDRLGHPVTSWQWSDGGLGGAFLPNDQVQNPTYTIANESPDRLSVTLTVTAGCDAAEPARGTASCTLVVRPHRDFADVGPAFWAFDAIHACYAAGLVTGYSDGTYRPGEAVTRDQMAVYLARALTGDDAAVPAGPATASFTDVPAEHWAYRHVEYVKECAVASGYPDGTYRPREGVTRDQMAVYLARATASPTGEEGLTWYTAPATPSFPDVPVGFWAYRHIEYLRDRRVVQGYADGYRPGEVVTRDQLAVYVARAFGL